jgi:hypothetical protein
MKTEVEETLHQKSFDFAQELVKQIITLSSGITALTITFFKDFAGANAPSGARTLMAVAWVFYLLAVAFGILAMMALAGSLSRGQSDINRKNMTLPAGAQFVSFILGLILTVWAGVWAL